MVRPRRPLRPKSPMRVLSIRFCSQRRRSDHTKLTIVADVPCPLSTSAIQGLEVTFEVGFADVPEFSLREVCDTHYLRTTVGSRLGGFLL